VDRLQSLVANLYGPASLRGTFEGGILKGLSGCRWIAPTAAPVTWRRPMAIAFSLRFLFGRPCLGPPRAHRTLLLLELLVRSGRRCRANVLTDHAGLVRVEGAYSRLAVSDREYLKSISAGITLQCKPVSSLDARRQVSWNQIRSRGTWPTAGGISLELQEILRLSHLNNFKSVGRRSPPPPASWRAASWERRSLQS
jgi:hypothetical protein